MSDIDSLRFPEIAELMRYYRRVPPACESLATIAAIARGVAGVSGNGDAPPRHSTQEELRAFADMVAPTSANR